MQVKLHQFIPDPLAENYSSLSDIWLQDNLVLTKHNYSLIISESGKGKSSLISSIYGLRKDYQGFIELNNKDIRSFNTNDWSRIRTEQLSIVFQSLLLFPKLSALDNVLVKNQLTNYKTEAEIRLFFEQLNISEQLNQLSSSLSFGQQQRVAIIRALCQPFEVLLLDEPFSHLDDKNTKLAWKLIQKESEKQEAKILLTALQDSNNIEVSQKYKI